MVTIWSATKNHSTISYKLLNRAANVADRLSGYNVDAGKQYKMVVLIELAGLFAFVSCHWADDEP